jgi:hypothetical protein
VTLLSPTNYGETPMFKMTYKHSGQDEIFTTWLDTHGEARMELRRFANQEIHDYFVKSGLYEERTKGDELIVRLSDDEFSISSYCWARVDKAEPGPTPKREFKYLFLLTIEYDHEESDRDQAFYLFSELGHARKEMQEAIKEEIDVFLENFDMDDEEHVTPGITVFDNGNALRFMNCIATVREIQLDNIDR